MWHPVIVSSVEQLAVERFTLGVAKVLASEWARLQTTHTAVTAHRIVSDPSIQFGFGCCMISKTVFIYS